MLSIVFGFEVWRVLGVVDYLLRVGYLFGWIGMYLLR